MASRLIQISGDQTNWNQIIGTPTTLAGYGITDAANSSHNHTFSTLTGITLTAPTNGQILQYNGTNWINVAAPSAPVQSVFGRTGTITANASDYSAFYPSNSDSRLSDNRTPLDGSVTNAKVANSAAIAWAKIDKTGATEFALSGHNHTFSTLSGVSLTSPGNGQLLQFNGTNWVNFTPAYLSSNQTITLSGAITGTGTTTITTTLSNTGITSGTFTKLTVGIDGRATAGTTLAASDIPFASDAWTTPTLNTGWSLSTDTPLTYRRLTSHINSLFIVGAAKYTLTTGAYYDAVLTLPVGSRPSNNRYIVGTIIKDGASYPLSIRLASDGRILVYLTASPSAQEIWLDCVIHL